MADPFRDEENAALIRAARLEEENERLRKELEEAKHPKPPPEEPKPKKTQTKKSKTDRPTPSAYALVCIIGAILIGVIAVAVGGRTRAQRMRDARLAKSLVPSPALTASSNAKRPADWVEDKRVTETDIRAVTHGVTPAVNYAVGAGGMILRRYGTSWSVEQSGTTADLHGVAEQLGKVCAVGDGGVAVCALDPAKPDWKLEKTGTIADLLALVQTYGFLGVGRSGTIVRRHIDGVWRREESGTKEDLFGVAPGYIVGAHGTILEQSDDKGWRKVPSPTTADLYAVESHLNQVVIVGAGGVMLQLGDPRAGFQLVSSGVTTDLYAVAHGSGFDTYAAGAGGVVLVSHGGGGAWVRQNTDTRRDLRAIDAWLPTMFIGGDHGTILSRKY